MSIVIEHLNYVYMSGGPYETKALDDVSLTIEPGVSSFKNYEALNTYRDGIYWLWYRSSVIIMFLQTAAGRMIFAKVK